MKTLEKEYHVDWLSIAQIPQEMRLVQVPKLRVPRFNDRNFPESLSEERQMVMLYNHLSEHEPQLGNLVVLGDAKKPTAVMLAPSKAGEQTASQVRVRAFSLKGIPEDDWEKLEKDVSAARKDAVDYANLRGNALAIARTLEGRVSVHQETKLLVAVGTEPYVEMVESIVAAHRANTPPPVVNVLSPPGK
ncbi:MAG: hypothetical protein NT154_15670 [Verrucomicrobia bacterium]|nr:hypothetical protein [Verrucomicrobiota bacterium]